MDRSSKWIFGFALFFFLLLFLPIYSERPSGPHVVFTGVANGASAREGSSNRLHSDFSHDGSGNHFGNRGLFVGANNFKTYAVEDFQYHFARMGYGEREILDQRCLYMLDEFVKYAQTYASYKEAIQRLHTELKNLGLFQKACRVARGTA